MAPTIEYISTQNNASSGSITTAGTDRLVVIVTLNSNNGANSLTIPWRINASPLTFTRVFHDEFDSNNGGTGQTGIDIFTAPAAAQQTSVSWTRDVIGASGSESGQYAFIFAIAGLHDITAPFDSNALSVAVAKHLAGGSSAPTVPITTSQANDMLLNLVLNAGSFPSQSATSGWITSPINFNPEAHLASGASDYGALLQNKAVSATQSAASIVAPYSDDLWYSLTLAFTADAGGVAFPNGGTYIPNPVIPAGTPGTAQITANNTITCTYTTDDVDEIILLFFNGQTGANALTAVQVSTVNDTNTLTWAKRTQKISASMNVSGGHTCLDTVEVWWAHSPTAQSGTITLVTNLTPDSMSVAAQPFLNVLSMTAPFDTDGSIPASSENDTTTGSVATETINTAAPGYVMGIWGSAAGGDIGADTGWTHLITSDTSSGTNWSRLNVVGMTTFSPQTGLVVDGTGSEASWVFIADALAGDTGLPANTWASIETPDSAAIVIRNGFPGVVADLAAIETLDLLAAVGFVASVGTMAIIEFPDTFAAAVRQPRTATLAVTETKDVFLAHGIGYGVNLSMNVTELLDSLLAHVLAVQPTNGVLAATETPDRFQALGAGAVRPSTSQTVIFFVA